MKLEKISQNYVASNCLKSNKQNSQISNNVKNTSLCGKENKLSYEAARAMLAAARVNFTGTQNEREDKIAKLKDYIEAMDLYTALNICDFSDSTFGIVTSGMIVAEDGPKVKVDLIDKNVNKVIYCGFKDVPSGKKWDYVYLVNMGLEPWYLGYREFCEFNGLTKKPTTGGQALKHYRELLTECGDSYEIHRLDTIIEEENSKANSYKHKFLDRVAREIDCGAIPEEIGNMLRASVPDNCVIPMEFSAVPSCLNKTIDIIENIPESLEEVKTLLKKLLGKEIDIEKYSEELYKICLKYANGPDTPQGPPRAKLLADLTTDGYFHFPSGGTAGIMSQENERANYNTDAFESRVEREVRCGTIPEEIGRLLKRCSPSNPADGLRYLNQTIDQIKESPECTPRILKALRWLFCNGIDLNEYATMLDQIVKDSKQKSQQAQKHSPDYGYTSEKFRRSEYYEDEEREQLHDFA